LTSHGESCYLLPLVSPDFEGSDGDGVVPETTTTATTTPTGTETGSGIDDVESATAMIEELRRQIDAVDSRLLHALAQRMSLVEQIGRYKRIASITTVQIERWMKLLEQRLRLGRSLKLPDGFVLAMFQLIHKESINLQNALVPASPEKVSL
jgi:chorismate mutase